MDPGSCLGMSRRPRVSPTSDPPDPDMGNVPAAPTHVFSGCWDESVEPPVPKPHALKGAPSPDTGKPTHPSILPLPVSSGQPPMEHGSGHPWRRPGALPVDYLPDTRLLSPGGGGVVSYDPPPRPPAPLWSVTLGTAGNHLPRP
ncbi:PREDICTED: extensin-like [Vollenhovia emeryi]|uniref:extensin-like n=1 Tax=Vollenhovia emeryi TaxID=411798 RepID=UPI0005F378F3|nr:PREDICTED: extensin-like [Vollenhovia emeryi]